MSKACERAVGTFARVAAPAGGGAGTSPPCPGHKQRRMSARRSLNRHRTDLLFPPVADSLPGGLVRDRPASALSFLTQVYAHEDYSKRFHT